MIIILDLFLLFFGKDSLRNGAPWISWRVVQYYLHIYIFSICIYIYICSRRLDSDIE